jgi:hypothetical protein
MMVDEMDITTKGLLEQPKDSPRRPIHRKGGDRSGDISGKFEH